MTACKLGGKRKYSKLKTQNSKLKTHAGLHLLPHRPGQLPAALVLETPGVLAFLDIAPVNYGHTLVISKVHYRNLLELPDELWMEMGQVSRRVAQALRATLYAQGFNIGMNNFEAAGQVVFHAHIHVIPRYFSDGLKLFPQESYKPGDLEKTAAQLRQAL